MIGPIRATLLTPAWLVLFAAAAAAQDDELARRLDSQALPTVRALLDSARAAGLPTEPLAAKALEGAAKRAGSDRITAAVRLLMRDLSAARSALGVGGSPAEIAAGATALRVGVDPGALRQLRGARHDLTLPLGVLTDLIVSGVPADMAVAAIGELAARGAADAEFAALPGQVRRDVSAGVPPGVAAVARARAALEVPAAGRRPETPYPAGRPSAPGLQPP